MTTVACPECQGPMFDNRETKRNPKAPDFKCKDRNCTGVVWPPKNGARPAPAAAPQKQAYSAGPALPYETETGAPPQTTSGKLDLMFALYGVCLAEAIQQAEKMNKADIGTTPEAVAAMCATLFIAAKDRGLAV